MVDLIYFSYFIERISKRKTISVEGWKFEIESGARRRGVELVIQS